MSALQPSFEETVKLGIEFISYTIGDATGIITVSCRDRNNNDTDNDDTVFERTCRVLIGADGVQSTFGDK